MLRPGSLPPQRGQSTGAGAAAASADFGSLASGWVAVEEAEWGGAKRPQRSRMRRAGQDRPDGIVEFAQRRSDAEQTEETTDSEAMAGHPAIILGLCVVAPLRENRSGFPTLDRPGVAGRGA